MAKEKFCKRCGAVLDDEVEEVLPDGTEQGRCSKCSRPYIITATEADPEVDPIEE